MSVKVLRISSKKSDFASSVAVCDNLSVSFRRIETITSLLSALSDRVPCEPLDGELVGEAAGMIAEEVAHLRTTLAHLQKTHP